MREKAPTSNRVTRVAERLVAALVAAAKALAPAAIPTAPERRAPSQEARRAVAEQPGEQDTQGAKAPKCSPAAP